jgi:hypothetical protein
VAAATIETTQKLKFKLFPHPAYCPDLAPSDYHIFGPFRDALCGCCFANHEVKETVPGFFTDGIRKLMDQSNKCVEDLRDYINK